MTVPDVVAVKVPLELTLVRTKSPPVVGKGKLAGKIYAGPDRGPIDVLRSYPFTETEEI